MVGHAATAVYVDTVDWVPASGRAALEGAGLAVRSAVARTPAEVVAAGAGALALLVGDSPVTADVIGGLPGLGIVSTVTAGVDHIDLDAAARAGVWVANVPDATTEEVASTALALALGLVRGVPFLDRHVRDGGWDAFAVDAPRRPSTLTLGIVGLGRIGRRLAALAAPAFGALVAHDPAPVAPWPDGIRRLGLDDLLATADVVSLHAPATPGAPPLLDAARLARLRPGAVLVNVARGSLVDTDALVAALDAGRLVAGLDVVDPEPLPVDHPLRRHPRAVVTPHAAFRSAAGEAEAAERQAGNVLAWLRDGRPRTPVVEGRPREGT